MIALKIFKASPFRQKHIQTYFGLKTSDWSIDVYGFGCQDSLKE